MRKALLFLLIGFFVFTMLPGCAKELTDEEMLAKLGDDKILARASEIIAEKETPPAQTVATSLPSAAAEQSPEPIPKIKPLAPIDLLGEKFNPFYNVKFPEEYEPYAAAFDTGDPGKPPGGAIYSLFLTAEGDPAEIVKYVCQLAGFDDQNSIITYVNGMNKNGYCTIDGTSNGKGMNIVCGIKKTNQGGDYDKCDDVDGCRLELIALIDNERIPEYKAFLTDNYNLKAFEGLAESLEDSLAPDKFSVEVNTQKPKFICSCDSSGK